VGRVVGAVQQHGLADTVALRIDITSGAGRSVTRRSDSARRRRATKEAGSSR